MFGWLRVHTENVTLVRNVLVFWIFAITWWSRCVLGGVGLSLRQLQCLCLIGPIMNILLAILTADMLLPNCGYQLDCGFFPAIANQDANRIGTD